MTWDLTVTLPNQPGQLADIAGALGTAGVNIEGGAGITAGGTGTLHLLVDDVEGAKRALADTGVEVQAEQEVLVVHCPDAPGELAARARKIADAGVNIDLFYVATQTRLVFGVDDAARGAAALES